ncbi:MAG: GTPase HflX [Acidilobaceae archaeon]
MLGEKRRREDSWLKAYLVIPKVKASQLGEALVLAEIAGYRVIRVWKTRYSWGVGRGLLEEIVESAREEKPQALIFYGNLKPSSFFKIAKEMGVRVLDRVMLILEIFMKHAGSREALLQIEIARLRHELPLVRELIRRKKLGELPGFLGSGGYATDSYYRHLTSRLAKLREELERLREMRRSRALSRISLGLPHVAIVGYASAGKTTLFNAVTGEREPTGEEYFTTLHTKHSSRVINGKKVVFVDTVGFIRDVPPEIIEAFHAVLEEVRLASVIIFVVDVSEDSRLLREKVEAGLDVLSRIEAIGIPIIVAANKIDKVSLEELEERVRVIEEACSKRRVDYRIVKISALKGLGLEELLVAVENLIAARARREAARGLEKIAPG